MAIVRTLLNRFKYCYLTLIIPFNINPYFTHIDVVSGIAHINSFICTQLNGLHLRDDIDRLYVSRKGGRGLARVEECVDASRQLL